MSFYAGLISAHPGRVFFLTGALGAPPGLVSPGATCRGESAMVSVRRKRKTMSLTKRKGAKSCPQGSVAEVVAGAIINSGH